MSAIAGSKQVITHDNTKENVRASADWIRSGLEHVDTLTLGSSKKPINDPMNEQSTYV
jgi:hypothetical protein